MSCSRLQAYYVEPDCQDADPSDPGSRGLGARRKPLFEEMDRLLPNSANKYVILLADSGMGKSSFVLNYYLRHISTSKEQEYPLVAIPLYKDKESVDDELRQRIRPEDRHNTIVLLDALDEDAVAIQDHSARINELQNLCKGCRNVVLTCRTQFFLDDNQIPVYPDDGLSGLGADTKALRYRRVYLSPFSDKQVRECLDKMFPSRRQKTQRREAAHIVEQIPDLKARPLVLSFIELLVQSGMQFTRLSQIYDQMVRRWMERETSRRLTAEESEVILEEFSERLAVCLFLKRAYQMNSKGLKNFTKKNNIKLEDWKLRGRSLLNRDAGDNYKFAHRSFMEFFIAKRIIKGKCKKKCDWSPLTLRFVAEMLQFSSESPIRLVGVSLRGINLEGAKLHGAIFSKADLTKAVLKR